MNKPNAKISREDKKSDFNFSQKLQSFEQASSQKFRELEKQSQPFLKKFWLKVVEVWHGILRGLKDLWHRFLKSFARWVDPKLEPYREPKQTKFDLPKNSRNADAVVIAEEVYAPVVAEAPQTRAELMELLHQVPVTALSVPERKAVAAVLSLEQTSVAEIMTPAVKIVFVNQEETLGPLILDRLYRSGFTFFPVIDGRQHIIGTLSTVLLNSLDIKETNQAGKIMDPRVYYIRSDYSLGQALKAFLRTSSQMMLVVDRYEKLMGMLTFSQLLDFLFDEKFQDDFDNDADRLAVAKRKIEK